MGRAKSPSYNGGYLFQCYSLCASYANFEKGAKTCTNGMQISMNQLRPNVLNGILMCLPSSNE